MAGGKDIHKDTHKAVGRVIARTERDIARAYSEMIQRVLKKLPLVNMGFVKGDGKTWEDLRKHPMFRKALHEEVERMTRQWERATRDGIGRGWGMGERESDALVSGYFAGRRVPKGLRDSYKHRNDEAMQAFLKRDGDFYSRRVWQEGERAERHLCDSIAEGLSEGLSAQELSRKVREDLRYPDKLFRRVQNKYGELVLSRSARAFHPGQGVYRSSYKNAMRLARTEINTAYRTADHERWQELDFVKGIRVSLSNNHTCNGVPFRDICDDLQGVYPKGFKFTGWHPQCRCIATPILEDFDGFLKRKINGGEAPEGVEEVPDNFKQWALANQDRIARAEKRGTLPHWYRDNQGLIGGVQGATQDASKTYPKEWREKNLARAKARHESRTENEIISTQYRWNNRQLNNAIGSHYEETGMDFKKANTGNGNLGYSLGKLSYKVNCQSCVVSHEMRLRGHNVTARPNTEMANNMPNKLSRQTELAWIDPKTMKAPTVQRAGGWSGEYNTRGLVFKTNTQRKKEFLENTRTPGRYHMSFAWKGEKYGHIVTLERKPNGDLFLYDPQNGGSINNEKSIISFINNRVSPRYSLVTYRVDNLLADVNVVKRVVYKTMSDL